MKRFLAALIVVFAASFAHADTINLLTNSYYSYSEVYTFPTNSPYISTFGTGVGMVIGEVYGNNYTNVLEWQAYGGTTVGNVTHFSSAYLYSTTFGSVSAFNATWNAKTDTFSEYYLSGGKTWHLTATSGQTNGTYGIDGYYTYTYGNLTSAKATTVPEPGSLALFGTGLLSLAGFARRRFLS
jgi:hypothetical protein